MDSKELRNLQEAYMDVYSELDEQLDEEEKDKTGYGIDTYASKNILVIKKSKKN